MVGIYFSVTISGLVMLVQKHIKVFENMANHENVISQYFAKKADEGMDILCENGTITLDTIAKWREEHMLISRK